MRLIAQIVNDHQAALFAYGPLGVICAWFMWRFEAMVKEFRTLSHRIDGMTPAMLVDVISRGADNPVAKRTAEEMLGKIERRDSGRR